MKTIIGSILLLWSISSSAQDTLTLQQCSDKLLNNSILFCTENKTLQESLTNNKLRYLALIPSLNFTAGATTNFGRRVDPFTNTFATKSVNSQSYQVSSSLPLFSGFNFYYTKRLTDLTLKQGELSLDRKRNELLIKLIELYVTLCKQEIQIRLSELRAEKYRNLKEIQVLLLKAGHVSPVDTLKSYNSLLAENLFLNQCKVNKHINEIELNYLTGQHLDASHRYDLTSISRLIDLPTLQEEIEAEALNLQLQIVRGQSDVSRSMTLPSLSLNSSSGTGFSTNNLNYALPNTPTKEYHTQIQENLFQSIGFYLNIPLYNRGTWIKSKAMTNISIAAITQELELKKLDLEKQQLLLNQEKLGRQTEISQISEIAANLKHIYEQSLVLYKEGRIDYSDLEMSFLEWQTKIIELETLKLDHEKSKLFNF